MAQLIEITQDQWLQVYNEMPISGKLPKAQVQDNLFSSLQWTGLEAIEKTQRKFWALKTENGPVSFLQSYFLSSQTLRLRGLCTLPAFQGGGYMKTLMKLVMELYKSEGLQIICFASEAGLPVCRAVGFKIIEDFAPRFVEYKSHKTQKWEEDRSSAIYMMKYAFYET